MGDWEGKKALIQACQAMKIQRFLFFSVNQCDRYEDVPLMDIKYKTERFLAESGLNYTTFRLCGFMQAIIGNYALPIPEIIALCERYAGQDAQVRNVPVWLLNATRAATNFFQWSRDAGDRLAFAEVLSSGAAKRAHGGDLPPARGGPRGHDRRREVPARVLHPDPAEAPRSERREQARGLLPVGDRGPAGARSPLYLTKKHALKITPIIPKKKKKKKKKSTRVDTTA